MTIDLPQLAEAAPAAELPLELHWTTAAGPAALPVRPLRAPRLCKPAGALPPVFEPGWFPANGNVIGAASGAFDFPRQMRQLCADIVSRCPFFHHIDIQRLLFSVTQARSTRRLGLQAKVTPMRFAQGALRRRRRGKLYQVQRFWLDGVEMLYLVSFCLPRFMDQSFDDKCVTIFHELHHIAPEFNGDLRRHGGRYSVHTHSQKGYDQQMAALAREYLTGGADPALHTFLRLNFDQLQARSGSIEGRFVPVPKLVPIRD